MKKLLLTFILSLSFVMAFSQAHVKGTGIRYDRGVPTVAPGDTSISTELLIDLQNMSQYQWDRLIEAWVKQFNVRRGNGAPSGDPVDGPEWYVDNLTRDIYWWNGSSWDPINSGGSGEVTQAQLDDSTASIRADFPIGSISDNYSYLYFERDSIYRQQTVSATDSVVYTTLNPNANSRDKLSRITSFDVQTGWTDTLTNVHRKTIVHSIVNQPSYNLLVVAQTDTTEEFTIPYSARRYLTRLSDVAAVDTTDGSYYYDNNDIPSPTNIYINPFDTIHPDSAHQYKLEVNVRNLNLDIRNSTGSKIQDIWVDASGYGYGPIAGGFSTQIDRTLITGGGIHHSVISSGRIANSVYAGYTRRIGGVANVFYSADATGLSAGIFSTIFYDAESGSYAHNSGGPSQAYDEIEYNNNQVWGFLDEADVDDGFSTDRTVNRVRMLDNYIEGMGTALFSAGVSVRMTGNVLRNNLVGISIGENPSSPSGSGLVENNLIITDPEREGAAITANSLNFEVPVLNNIFIANRAADDGDDIAAKVLNVGNGDITFTKNIFVCDVQAGDRCQVTRIDLQGVTGNPNGYRAQDNIYILVSGAGFYWSFINQPGGSPQNTTDFAEYKTLTEQDTASLYLDLTGNSRGLREIFLDPANGDFRLNPRGNYFTQIIAMGAGMTTPPTAFPSRPYNTEEAVYRAFSGNMEAYPKGQNQVLEDVSSDGSGGAVVFTELTDTPVNYTGQENKMLLVNPTGDALIFADTSGLGGGGGGSGISGLTANFIPRADSPTSIVNSIIQEAPVSSKIGINRVPQDYTLEVQNISDGNGYVSTHRTGASKSAGFLSLDSGGPAWLFGMLAGGNDFRINSATGTILRIQDTAPLESLILGATDFKISTLSSGANNDESNLLYSTLYDATTYNFRRRETRKFFAADSSMWMPSGTTAERVSPANNVEAEIRWNTETKKYEYVHDANTDEYRFLATEDYVNSKSYAQIAQTVTFNGNSNDRIDTISIDDTWNILSRPENFAVIDTTTGDWNADSLAVGKLIYLGSKTKKFRFSVSFSGDMDGTGDSSWLGVLKNGSVLNNSVKSVWFENLVHRDYHLSFLVELATNDTLDVRLRDDTASSQTVYLYSCNLSLSEL